MPDIPLRARFPLGCRVRFAPLARATVALRRDITATVVGYGQGDTHVYLVREGNRPTNREKWPVDMLERLEDPPHA
jgi:hypothetical protein